MLYIIAVEGGWVGWALWWQVYRVGAGQACQWEGGHGERTLAEKGWKAVWEPRILKETAVVVT